MFEASAELKCEFNRLKLNTSLWFGLDAVLAVSPCNQLVQTHVRFTSTLNSLLGQG